MKYLNSELKTEMICNFATADEAQLWGNVLPIIHK